MTRLTRGRRNALIALVATCTARLAWADASAAYPQRPVRLVVPFPAGSGTDSAARIIADRLRELGQPFVVENKPGAGGSIAAMDVARAESDGYTLLFSSNSVLSSNVALLRNLPYDPNKDFTPIASVGVSSLVLMVRADFPATNVKEFLEQVRKSPGKFSAGYGSSSAQVATAMLAKDAQLDILQVPYKGIPVALSDLMGGSIDFAFVDIGNAMSQGKSSRVRALAVSTSARSSLSPNLPPLRETFPRFDVSGWVALVGPARLPAPVVEILSGAISSALNDAGTRQRLMSVGFDVLGKGPDELKRFMRDETLKWIQAAKDAQIEPQ